MKTTILPVPTLGDCLLHRTHHEMEQKCWGVVLDWILERSETHPDEPQERTLDMFKATYERALLDDLIALQVRSRAGDYVSREFNG